MLLQVLPHQRNHAGRVHPGAQRADAGLKVTHQSWSVRERALITHQDGCGMGPDARGDGVVGLGGSPGGALSLLGWGAAAPGRRFGTWVLVHDESMQPLHWDSEPGVGRVLRALVTCSHIRCPAVAGFGSLIIPLCVVFLLTLLRTRAEVHRSPKLR
jgi:hypothetical protein